MTRTNVYPFRNSLHLKRRPTEEELASIPLAMAGEFELTDRELNAMRKEIYKINHDGIRKFRTLREGKLVMVWRIK